jgi:parvulin-like peptidyl-prolyl isomerase
MLCAVRYPLRICAAWIACAGLPAVLACSMTPPVVKDSPSAAEVGTGSEAASEAPIVDKEAAEKCLALAGAKRARATDEPDKVTVKHVLVKYAGAKNADDKVQRPREAACLRALEARDKIREGADFAEVVKQYSDEAGAATREGSIGSVSRKDVAKPFADAAFELKASQLSDVVETEFGFHVIFRTE